MDVLITVFSVHFIWEATSPRLLGSISFTFQNKNKYRKRKEQNAQITKVKLGFPDLLLFHAVFWKAVIAPNKDGGEDVLYNCQRNVRTACPAHNFSTPQCLPIQDILLGRKPELNPALWDTNFLSAVQSKCLRFGI